MSERRAKRYRRIIAEGLALGYPECCTLKFVRSLQKAPDFGPIHHPSQWKAGAKTGFIPCRRCAAKVNKRKIKLVDLIRGRLVSWEFSDVWTAYYDVEADAWDPLTTTRMGELERIAREIELKTKL